MPSYMPTHMPRVGRLPLTPPEVWGQYTSTNTLCATAPGFYPYGNNDSRYTLEPQGKYGYTKPLQMQAEQQYHEQTQIPASGYSANNARQDYMYGAIGAPILPPIRIPQDVMEKQQQRPAHTISNNVVREQPKEEKVAGGVAAHLDYEMDQMIDFVAEAAQGLYDFFTQMIPLAEIDVAQSVQPTSAVTPEFRKYVSQILTSTRLPSSTIMLALHYLDTRMEMLQAQKVYTSSTGHLYHMLTIALMLASKFLDDNTFQNRSWAEVSHIPVTELNKQEREWLEAVAWKLPFDPNDPNGFASWITRWERYCAKKMSLSMEALKLTPVDPVRGQYSVAKYGPQTPVYTPTCGESDFSSAMRDRMYQPWQQWQPVRTLSPPSADPSFPNTPDWYKMGFNQHSMALSNRPLPPPQILPSNHSPYYTGYPSQQYTLSPWNGHGAGCGCGYCALSHERYPLANNYGVQTVMG